eukprot:g2801.t1
MLVYAEAAADPRYYNYNAPPSSVSHYHPNNYHYAAPAPLPPPTSHHYPYYYGYGAPPPSAQWHQRSSRPVPPPHYTCHRCGVKGHYIQDCTAIPSTTQQQQQQERPRVKRKREIEPERNSVGGTFRCASCDRDFASERAMQTHVAKHITCSHEGCTFSAVPKIVREHYRVKHTDEAPKLPKSLRELVPRKYLHAHRQKVDPESVRTWIEARRSNYPTDAKIAEKRTKGGQETFDNEDGGNDDDKKKGSSKAKQVRSAAAPTTTTTPTQTICRAWASAGRCRFGERCRNVHGNIADVDCRLFLRGQCRKGASCKYRHDRDMARLHQSSQRLLRAGGSTTLSSSDGLLRKLIRSDMDYELSYIAQCIRYVVENKFFDDDSDDDDDDASRTESVCADL